MLMNIDCSIIQSIKVSLTFDNNKIKEREISVGDLCMFEFNKNGKRKMIEGRVIKICAGDTLDVKAWYIIVDGSLSFAGQTERFCPTQILDVDVIQKHDAKSYVETPNDSTRVTHIAVKNGYLKVSTDGGYSYFSPKVGVYPYVEDESEVAPPHRPSHGGCGGRRPKPVQIEGGDDMDFTDESDEIEEEVY